MAFGRHGQSAGTVRVRPQLAKRSSRSAQRRGQSSDRRGTPGLAVLLCLHLGAVMALFATLPYGKFGHGIFRSAALLRHAIEKRQPNTIGLAAD
mgnify:CR=1 FL=1